MTALEDAFAISNAILVLVCLPVFLRVWPIIIQALQNGYLSQAGSELGWTMLIIGFGGIAFAVLISAVGALIDGGFAE